MFRRCLLASILFALCACSEQPQESSAATGIRFLSEPADDRGFDFADRVIEFEFPRDHGMHPTFATEWWYFTGNLRAEQRRFGFELTFFRYALGSGEVDRESHWGSNQVWLAHFTVTDAHSGKFLMDERMGRGALGIAGAAEDRLSINVRDWSARSDAVGDVIWLEAKSSDAEIALELSEFAPIALHGEHGLDKKGAASGNASYYYSIPRMSATGSIRVSKEEDPIAVSGTAWLDREWGTSTLDQGVEGWDWFGLQLSDGSNLMLYRLRNSDGSLNQFGTGSVMYPDGRQIRLTADDIQYAVVDRWTSPGSGVTYPIDWQVSIPSIQLQLRVSAVIDSQEFNLGLRYWEGAVDVSGTAAEAEISGEGYLELAGY